MEFVRGSTITEYCDVHRLSPTARLELLAQVCKAVQHAHQKGIIHRDLKRGNVLVVEVDGRPTPKVIDFGVAKDTEQRLTDQSFGDTGAIVGTPTYMSPKQADPSSIDWIVMKALEKNRNRRYETASGFAADIQRFLANEPVLARPPSRSYRMRKFVRRNRTGVIAASLVMLALVVGVVGTTLGLIEARRQRDIAERARQVESLERAKAVAERDQKEKALLAEAEQRRRAEEARRMADQETAIAKAVNDFLQNDLLAEAAPEKNARDKKVTVQVYLQALEARRRTLVEEHPDTLTGMGNLALFYLGRNEYARAETLLKKAVEVSRRVQGEEHYVTLIYKNNLATVYQGQGRLDEAEALHLQVLEARRRLLGPKHSHTVGNMTNLAKIYFAQRRYDEAEPLFIRALEIQRRILGNEHVDTLSYMNNLAMLHAECGRYAQAEPLFVDAVGGAMKTLMIAHPNTQEFIRNLIACYEKMRQPAQAEAWKRRLGLADLSP